MNLNLTHLAELSPQQQLYEVHALVTLPSLIILFGFAILIFFFTGMAYTTSDKGKATYRKIFITASILLGAVFVFLLICPGTVMKIIEWIATIFG